MNFVERKVSWNKNKGPKRLAKSFGFPGSLGGGWTL